MKKSVIKNVLLSVFFAIFMVTSIFGLALSNVLPKKSAKADTAAWQTGVFEMDDGASLKLGEVGGLRFVVRMDETVADFVQKNDDAELGFVIAPKQLMLAANGDYLKMPKKIGGAIDKNKIYQDGDYYFANGCIKDIKAANLERSFTAIAYIKYGDEVRYTEYNDLARNSLYDTVNMAVLNGYADQIFNEKAGGYAQAGENQGWYGSEKYPIVVGDSEEYDSLVDMTNEGINLKGYHVVVKNNATTDKVFTNTETAPNIVSSALDEVNKLLDSLSGIDSNKFTMPEAIGLVAKIHEAEEKYNALSDADQAEVNAEHYAIVQTLLPMIEGYDRVYKNDADDGTLIPSHVPNYTSTISGTATTKTDDLYGNVLKVTSDANGKAALHYQNFPSIEKYAKIYFYVKVDVDCNLYLSDGTTNDGWGDNWKNNWSVDGYWCNADTWRLVEINPADGYIGNNFAIGFRADNPGFTFEISDFYGIVTEKCEAESGLSFGVITDAGTHETYGQIRNLTQAWDSATDLGSIGAGKLGEALADGHNALRFWMYNPVASEVNLYGSCAGHDWAKETLATLAPNAWTEVVIKSNIIEATEHAANDLCICVKDVNDTGVAKTAGWKISKIYSFYMAEGKMEATLDFGAKTDTGNTNDYGRVYNISREQWYIDNNNLNTIGTLQANKLANALPEGYEYFYFWMYNPTDTAYNFHLAGDCSGTWTDSADTFELTSKAWTKVTISAADIELNKQGQWYVYILGGDGQGAAKDGWQISTIYAGPDKEQQTEIVYLDHADVKEAIALIDAISETVTLADEEAIKAARAAYDKLADTQKAMVGNYAKLTAAEDTFEDIQTASEVIALIDSINARDLDEALVQAARKAYDALSDSAKERVTNLDKLESYEAQINAENATQAVIDMIAALPDSVVMPDHLVFVTRIEAARDAYNALSDEAKNSVENYAKLRTLVNAIKGYETVHVQSVDGVNVIPSHVPNYTSTIGGTASMGYDGYYGDYLIVTPNEGGKAAIQFKNFPDVTKYTKIYFNIRVVGESCNVYISDGITNDGWGDGWHNNWSMDGYWANDGSWIQKEVNVSTGMITSNWALGLRASATGVSFEITNIVGVYPDLGAKMNTSFGNIADSGTTNEYGPVYNFTQGWSSATDLGAFNAGVIRSALNEGHDAVRFYIYNPQDSDVVFYTMENETWTRLTETTLTAKAWTEVVLTSEVIASNDTYLTYICVESGAGTSGWQISPIYSYSTVEAAGDEVDKVQNRINALNAEAPDESQVQLAREAYEALTEALKALVDVTNLTACEESLYGDVADAPFIVAGETQYKLYIDQTADAVLNEAIKEAAAFFNQQLVATTGTSLPVVDAKPARITKYDYAIVFGYVDLYSALTEVPEEEIGLSGYYMEKIGRTLFVEANGAGGYRMAVIALLRELVGYDMLAEDCIIYDASKAEKLPTWGGDNFSMEIPSFDYRQKQTYMTETEVYGMGLQSNTDLWIPSSGGWDMHNTLHYLPTETYQSAHPSWYYTYTDSVSVERTQICPTAGGSSAEFNAMVAAIAENMLVRINMFPERENISFSIMDTGDGDDCTCARCKLYDTLYGEGGFAAAWIDLMNAVNAKIRESLPENRVLNIAFLAYRATEKAPANDDYTLMKRYQINDDGSYTQTSEDLKCDEGVTVWLAPINAKYAENFNHADNAEHLATVKKWCALSDSVYIWAYGANFKFYMYPYNSWQASAENYKIFKELGVKAVWSQSNETEATAFSDLKGYIDSKFMFNVNANYETVLNTYFTNYFGAGATQMRSMFDAIVAKCNEIEANYDGLGRGIYDELENTSGFLGIGAKTYWSKDWLEGLVTLCDEAKAAVDADTTLTDAQKTAIKNRITKESLFPRYVLCTTFAGKYSSSVKKSMRQAFKADATALGITLYREAEGELSDLYSDWGV